MKFRIAAVLLIITVIGGGISIFWQNGKSERISTEDFIGKWLKNENNTLATYIQRATPIDEDSTAGREALAESLGLWMQYSVAKNDQILFDQAYHLLLEKFLDSNGFIYWKLDESGSRDVVANALVDDLRIAQTLMEAADLWESKRYMNTAEKIIYYTTTRNVNHQYLVDYYDKELNLAGPYLTLSYVKTDALTMMRHKQLVPQSIYETSIKALMNAPYQGPFLPKRITVETETYHYDQDVNIVDQSIAAYYAQLAGKNTEHFYRFIRSEMKIQQKIFGKYDLDSQTNTVDYESPAIYGWLILYLIEYGDEKLALQIYDRMIDFRQSHGQYKGGYSVYDDDTHIFDNLIPLIAEQELYHLNLLP